MESNFFTYSIDKIESFTQTEQNFFEDFKGSAEHEPWPLPPRLNSTTSTLSTQYRQNVGYYIANSNPSTFSKYREDILTRMKEQSLFFQKIFGENSDNLDRLPANAFLDFSVSLYLVLHEETFSFYSVVPGFEISGEIDLSNGVISHLMNGNLPPHMFEKLKDMTLTWYDGGLICEVINDTKSFNNRPVRILVRINNIDLMDLGYEIEQEYLNFRYPLLCLDNDIQVARLARMASYDRLKWNELKPDESSPAIFLEKEYPSLFIEKERKEIQEKKPNKPKYSDEEIKKKLREKLGMISKNS